MLRKLGHNKYLKKPMRSPRIYLMILILILITDSGSGSQRFGAPRPLSVKLKDTVIIYNNEIFVAIIICNIFIYFFSYLV
jgi:hypothetical protein